MTPTDKIHAVCEWCESSAVIRLICRETEYQRYSCQLHIAKVRRLADLDGYESANPETQGELIELRLCK